MKEKEFAFEPLPTVEKEEQNTAKISREAIHKTTTRMCVDMPEHLVEKIKDHAYWCGFTQQEIIIQAVTELVAHKPIKDRPETVKNRPKPGRKPKS
jgi:predicted DNA binding CopG/RHH family protein